MLLDKTDKCGKKVGVSRWEESWRALWPLVLSRGRKLFNCQKHDNTVKNKLNEAYKLWNMSQRSSHSEMLYSWKTFHQRNYVLRWSLWMITLGDVSKLCHRLREASVSSPYPTPSPPMGLCCWLAGEAPQRLPVKAKPYLARAVPTAWNSVP